MSYVFAAVAWLAMVGFGTALLLVGITAGRVARRWTRLLLLVLELIVEGVILLALFAEVWFLAKTAMAFGVAATPALILAILVGLLLVVPTVVLVWVIAGYGYTLFGRGAQLRSDFRRSIWVSRINTFRPGDF
jgi:hypothetical protein